MDTVFFGRSTLFRDAFYNFYIACAGVEAVDVTVYANPGRKIIDGTFIEVRWEVLIKYRSNHKGCPNFQPRNMSKRYKN